MPRSLISITEARQRVLDATTPLGAEPVELDDALGRVLAQDVAAADDVPPFPCSAMDGYAVIAGDAGRTLRIVGESRAGTPSSHELTEGEAIRISTGAAVPPGATAVIPQENVDLNGGDAIHTNAAARAGEHIRGAGEDMRAQTVVLGAGTRLGPVALGAAAAAGVGSVIAARRPRVSVLCTGDELRAPGEPLGPGEIHNSNAPMLIGFAQQAGAVTTPARRLPDDPEATRDGIGTALAQSDVVIISGGVSVGPHDHVKPALDALGVQEVFWSVALQPGKPTWFGVPPAGHPLVFGLPGNPVSAVVTFSLFVAPALAALQGAPNPEPPRPTARLGVDVARNPRRDQMIRVRLSDEADVVRAFPNGAQGSHILTSLLGADALALIPSGEGELPSGTAVTLHALAG
ncbi:MAG TPA: gephyrin-like molybdotransferase Glp [Solirubrobacteraceae bacterium]|jgi:molybdopterin molybdotransferase|nr:gephyrin-like molybdotransferase Glp [Solirubrobacteraceae bacterium]